jgi:imidazoleglycerol-phosphate dehydratase
MARARSIKRVGVIGARNAASSRSATIERKTKETQIELTLTVDGSGRYDIQTGVPFLNHMLELFTRHGFFDLTIRATGDVEVDDHHTVEDVGLALGKALRDALGAKEGIRRFGETTVPLDEALVQVVVDLSGRPFLAYDLKTRQTRIIEAAFKAMARALDAATQRDARVRGVLSTKGTLSE